MTYAPRISVRDVITIHDASIRKFGGATGLRDENLLISALAQPFQTFEGVDLYPGVVTKACRCAFGIIANHPFIDGNKRTGAAVLGVLLRLSGYDFHPNHEAFLRIIFGVADGSVSCSKLTSWVYLVLQIPDE
ncbi:type II toxin-antitoxin system death-on-curing family toxin [uncultured Olegusella sp.]|uniref:type II toxin-antitoxin system death-on-curing family toxin n=1 Tax=uncultured Olegusella sp. TaxID=1979846 RepID=UPI002617D519|nr:type II toxin-antitoxin system death-on-curing family toxin [uncultured Olegusella sp.]